MAWVVVAGTGMAAVVTLRKGSPSDRARRFDAGRRARALLCMNRRWGRGRHRAVTTEREGVKTRRAGSDACLEVHCFGERANSAPPGRGPAAMHERQERGLDPVEERVVGLRADVRLCLALQRRDRRERLRV